MITVNAVTLIFLFYNTVQFLIRQQRYKVLYLSLFYAISITIITLRVLYFSVILVYLRAWNRNQKLCPYRSLNNIDNFAAYFDLTLGIQTMSMMIDLALMVKTTAAKEFVDRETML